MYFHIIFNHILDFMKSLWAVNAYIVNRWEDNVYYPQVPKIGPKVNHNYNKLLQFIKITVVITTNFKLQQAPKK